MNFIKIEKRILKWLGISLGVIGVLLIVLHFWLVNNAEKIIEDLVEKESKGKLKLKVGNLKFSYFSKNMELQKLSLYSVDTSGSSTSYRFTIDYVRLKVNEILPVIFKNRISIDSFRLLGPQIEITRLNPGKDTARTKNISVPDEFGRIYNSIQDALGALHVNRFQIDEGKIILYNKEPGQLPVTISNLHFHIDNLNPDSTENTLTGKFLSSDNIVLRTRNQDISFPGGIHRLAFSRFRINIRKKVFEIDSCTVSEIKNKSTNPGFSVFFDKLKITSVDFKSLAEKEMLEADSAFCTNPVVKLTVAEKINTGNKKDLPDIARIIQRFTGNMHINYVGVTNAALRLALVKKDGVNSFVSDHNNFEVKGIRIDTSQINPFKLESFAMAIRNQEIKLENAGYTIRFDSILVIENRIMLNNFFASKRIQQSANEIKIKSLQLSGLSWSDLLFRGEIKAEQADLYNPIITYNEPAIKKRKKKTESLYKILNSFHEFLHVKKLQINNAIVTCKLNNNVDLRLTNFKIQIEPNRLLSSARPGDIQNAVSGLSFSDGKITSPEYELQIQNAIIPGKTNNLHVENINFTNTSKTISVTAHKVDLDNIYADSISKNISLKYLGWQKADINLQIKNNKEAENPGSPRIKLNRLNLQNTNLTITKGDTYIKTNFQKITSGLFMAGTQGELNIEELLLSGSGMQIKNNAIRIQSGKYDIADNKNSYIDSMQFTKFSPTNTLNAFIPRLELTPSVNQAIRGKINLQNAVINSPVIKYIKNISATNATANENSNFPDIVIGDAEINKPDIFILVKNKKNETELTWKNDLTKQNNRINIKNLLSLNGAGLTAEEIKIDANSFSFSNSDNKKIDSKDGQLKFAIQRFSVSQHPAWEWSATLHNFKADNFIIDSLGKNKNKLLIETFSLNGLQLNQDNYKIPEKFMTESPSFSITDFTGEIANRKTFFKWNALSYIHRENLFSIDSLSVRPVPDRESFIASQKFQKEYVNLQTGKITITRFNPVTYLKDSLIKAGLFSINNARLNIYHDKRLPYREGDIKPLPAELIKNIPVHFSIDTLKYDNLDLVYTELNDITMQTGTVPVNRMYGIIFPLRNTNLTPTDTLNIRANGYLMDSLWLRVRIRESYEDSLAGFFVSLRMRPGPLAAFNSFLPQLSSLKINSGMLDTLSMRAIGMEYLSYGEMKAFYHNLKLEFLKNDYEAKKVFLRGLITFIATNFIIKKENKSRTGRVFFTRIRERSIINYIIKMAMSGLASSAGAKNRKKMLRKYKRELQLRNLPPLDYD